MRKRAGNRISSHGLSYQEAIEDSKGSLKREASAGDHGKSNPDNTKLICWKIEKTGPVGESLIHMCMLNAYHGLAKRVLMHFPKLVNDFYMSETYYGTISVHSICLLNVEIINQITAF